MKLSFLFIFAFVFACEKPESKPNKSKPNIKIDASVKTEPTAKKKTANSEMANVHAALLANKKILAIKEYRKIYRFPLHACKQAVEIEQTKLKLPSVDTVHRLMWNGKTAEAKAHLRKVFPSLTDASVIGKLAQMGKRVGPATEENLNAHIKNGKLGPALMIYHHLNPGVEMPEMYRIVSAKMPKKVKY